MKRLVLLLCGLSISIGGVSQVSVTGKAVQPGFSDAALKEFAALEPIDIHSHILRSDPAFSAMLQRLHLHLLDILVVDVKDNPEHRLLELQKQDAWRFVSANAGRASLSTNFDPFVWGDHGFPGSVVASIDKDFASGAVAVTMWTNVSMTAPVKDASGKPVLPDDATLEPIYKDIASHHKTLIAHLTGADEAWAPGYADGSAILQARDRVMRRNPELRVVGVHLGSAKEDLDHLSRRLEQYPNFAVDTSGRISYLMTLPREQALAFLLKFQDRILYGADMGFHDTDVTEDVVANWQSRYALEWRYLSSDDTFEYKGAQVHCLHLPAPVLRKLYHDNAVRWIPGIAQ